MTSEDYLMSQYDFDSSKARLQPLKELIQVNTCDFF